jgi:hypothetical protein
MWGRGTSPAECTEARECKGHSSGLEERMAVEEKKVVLVIVAATGQASRLNVVHSQRSLSLLTLWQIHHTICRSRYE